MSLVEHLQELRSRLFKAGRRTCWYAGVLAGGLDAAVNERAHTRSWSAGPRTSDPEVLAELRSFTPVPVTLTLDGRPQAVKAMLVAAGTTSSYGGGMRICPDAVVDDGLLDVTVLGPVSVSVLARLLPQVYRGSHVRHPAVTTYRAREVTVDGASLPVYADGERFGSVSVTCTVRPDALTLLC